MKRRQDCGVMQMSSQRRGRHQRRKQDPLVLKKPRVPSTFATGLFSSEETKRFSVLLPQGVRCQYQVNQPPRESWEQAEVINFNPTATAGTFDLDAQDRVKGYRIAPIAGVKIKDAWLTNTMVMYNNRHECNWHDGVLTGFNEKVSSYNLRVLRSNDEVSEISNVRVEDIRARTELRDIDCILKDSPTSTQHSGWVWTKHQRSAATTAEATKEEDSSVGDMEQPTSPASENGP